MTSRKDHQRGGIFIAFEGADGSGKTTQAERAAAYVRERGREVLLVREPGGTPIGERVRQILLDPALTEMGVRAEVFLYMAARAQLVEEVLRPALEGGKVVLADRFLLSSIVYQGMAGGLGAAVVREMGALAAEGIVPDLTIVLSIEAADVAERSSGKKDRMEDKAIEFHEKVRRGYAQAAAAAGEEIRLVPASGSIDEVAALVRKEIDRVLG